MGLYEIVREKINRISNAAPDVPVSLRPKLSEGHVFELALAGAMRGVVGEGGTASTSHLATMRRAFRGIFL